MSKTIECDCPRDASEHLDTCVTTCAYCGAEESSRDAEHVPATDAEWAERAKGHADDCEWIRTRAHSRPMYQSESVKAEYIGSDEHERGMVRWYKVTDTTDSSDGAYAVYADRARAEGSGRWIGTDQGADDVTDGHRAAIAADKARMAGYPGDDN